MQISIGNPESKETSILKDGGHIYLSCSNCEACLVDIWIVGPGHAFKAYAKCPFCNDKSFSKVIDGDFRYGGFGKMTDEDNDLPSTIIENVDIQNGCIVFDVKKADKKSKPLRKIDE